MLSEVQDAQCSDQYLVFRFTPMPTVGKYIDGLRSSPELGQQLHSWAGFSVQIGALNADHPLCSPQLVQVKDQKRVDAKTYIALS